MYLYGVHALQIRHMTHWTTASEHIECTCCSAFLWILQLLHALNGWGNIMLCWYPATVKCIYTINIRWRNGVWAILYFMQWFFLIAIFTCKTSRYVAKEMYWWLSVWVTSLKGLFPQKITIEMDCGGTYFKKFYGTRRFFCRLIQFLINLIR